MLFKEKKRLIHPGRMSPFPVLISLILDCIYLLGLISKRNEKAKQEFECPTFLEIPVTALVLLKFSAYPTESFKVLASFNSYNVRIHHTSENYLLPLFVLCDDRFCNTVSDFILQKGPQHVLQLGLKCFYFLHRIMAK